MTNTLADESTIRIVLQRNAILGRVPIPPIGQSVCCRPIVAWPVSNRLVRDATILPVVASTSMDDRNWPDNRRDIGRVLREPCWYSNGPFDFGGVDGTTEMVC